MKATFEQQAADLTKIDKNKIQNKEMIIMHSELEALTAQIKKYDENPDSKTINSSTTTYTHLFSELSKTIIKMYCRCNSSEHGRRNVT